MSNFRDGKSKAFFYFEAAEKLICLNTRILLDAVMWIAHPLQ